MVNFAGHLSFRDRPASPRLGLSRLTHTQINTQSHSSPSVHIKHTHVDLDVSVALALTLVSCQTMKTLRDVFLWCDLSFCLTEKHMHSTCRNYGFIRLPSNTQIMHLPLCPLSQCVLYHTEQWLTLFAHGGSVIFQTGGRKHEKQCVTIPSVSQ